MLFSGTLYCAADHKIYINPAFPELQQIGLTGDFTKALIVAREVGHHVQNISDVPHQAVAASNQEAAIIRSEQLHSRPIVLPAYRGRGDWTRGCLKNPI